MEPLDFSAIISRYGQTTDVPIHSWSIPFGGLQTEYIVWKYKTIFPGQILAERIKLWPKALAESLHDDFPAIDMDQVRAAAEEHEKERQIILDGMRNLVIQKTVLLAMDPLTKLELYEDLKYRGFQKDIKNRNRCIRKFFPWLLPKRKYKHKKKSFAKIQKRHEKKKLAKKLKNSKSSMTARTSDISDLTPFSLWGQKEWDPMQPKYVEPPVTYATSGCFSKDYQRIEK